MDLSGISQSVGGLDDYGVGGGGAVTNNGTGPATLTVAPPTTSTFSGVVQDGTGQTLLTVAGPGTQVLTGSNTYTGVTTILGGTLQLGNGSNTGSIDNTSAVINNGTLAFNRSDNVVFNPPISGSGGLTQMGTGALAIGSPASYTGPTAIKSGTLQSAAPGATAGLVIGYSFNGSGSIGQYQSFADLSGNGYTLYAYDGNSSYVAGNGHFANGVSMQSNLLYCSQSSDGGPTTNQPLPVLNTWTDNIWFNAPSSALNSGSWTALFGTTWKTGNNVGLILDYVGANTWDHLGASPGFYNEFGDITGNNACINDWGAGQAIPYTITPGDWYMVTQVIKGQTFSFYVNGQLVGSYNLNGNTPQFAQPSAGLTLGYANGQWGAADSLGDFDLYNNALSATQISQLYNQGYAQLQGNVPAASAVTLSSGATFDLMGSFQPIGSLSDGVGGGTVTNSTSGAAVLALGTTGTAAFSGVINDGLAGGTVAVEMDGTGIQTLSGSNNYSGGTTINSGVLSISNDYNLGRIQRRPDHQRRHLAVHRRRDGERQSACHRGRGAGIDVPSGTLAFAGGIADTAAGPGGVYKTGGGVLQLDGLNSYSGPTTIAVGTLAGNGTLASAVEVLGGAHIAAGDNTAGNFGSVGTLSVAALTLDNGAQADFDLGTSSDLISVAGLLTLNGATINVENSGGLSSGTYEVMSYGTLASFNASSLVVGSMPNGFSARSSTAPWARTRSICRSL